LSSTQTAIHLMYKCIATDNR